MCIFNWKLELSTVFQTPSKTSIKELRVRYAELITLMIISKKHCQYELKIVLKNAK